MYINAKPTQAHEFKFKLDGVRVIFGFPGPGLPSRCTSRQLGLVDELGLLISPLNKVSPLNRVWYTRRGIAALKSALAPAADKLSAAACKDKN